MSIKSSKKMKRYNHLLGEIEATYHELSLKLNISDSISKILYTICNFGDNYLLGDICRYTGLSKQTVNSALRKLENEGLIYLEAVNGKSKKVCLTDKGKEFADKTAFRILQLENEIFDTWSDEDMEKYLELTETFLTSLKEKVEKL